MTGEKFWQLGEGQLYSLFRSSARGITDAEASARRKEKGLNEIPEEDRKTAFSIFVSQLKSPLFYILAFATLVSFYLGDTIEALVVLLILAVNAGLGFYQEYQAENALRNLKKRRIKL